MSNMNEVRINSIGTFYFSYETCVAFYTPEGLVITENNWGPTTGKHLNWVEPDKSKRIPLEDFNSKLQEVMYG